MSIGKYSPTVSMWYARDQEWFEKNGGHCTVYNAAGEVIDYTLYDKDGYDSYGYHKDTELDRAGNYENDYLTDSLDYWDLTETEGCPLYEDASREYCNQFAPTCPGVEKRGDEWVIVKLD